MPSRKGRRTDRHGIDAVVEAYGDMRPYELIDRTRSEAPWKDARQGVPDGGRGRNVISDEAIYSHHSHLDAD